MGTFLRIFIGFQRASRQLEKHLIRGKTAISDHDDGSVFANRQDCDGSWMDDDLPIDLAPVRKCNFPQFHVELGRMKQ